MPMAAKDDTPSLPRSKPNPGGWWTSSLDAASRHNVCAYAVSSQTIRSPLIDARGLAGPRPVTSIVQAPGGRSVKVVDAVSSGAPKRRRPRERNSDEFSRAVQSVP